MGRILDISNYSKRVLVLLMCNVVMTEDELIREAGLDKCSSRKGMERLNTIYRGLVADGFPVFKKILVSKWTRTGRSSHRENRLVIYYVG